MCEPCTGGTRHEHQSSPSSSSSRRPFTVSLQSAPLKMTSKGGRAQTSRLSADLSSIASSTHRFEETISIRSA